ncbi:hypothetical protein B0H13DRAFT_1863643 [Mycena leptocephala]|nr:hypothetical protein B0H13DRAFT_1863643 [Mycena leptocephala]
MPRPPNRRVKQVTEPQTIDLEEPHGRVVTRIDPETKIHYVTCDLCGTDIKMSVAANRVNLLKHRNKEGREPLSLYRAPTLDTLASATPSASGSTTPAGATTPRQYYRSHVRNESISNITTGLALLGTDIQHPLVSDPVAGSSNPSLSNAKRSNGVAQRKISEHRRIMMLLATNDIPGLRRMLTVLAKRGASPRAIRSTLERALAGTYSAIAGPRLLYDLQKSHGLASVSTVRRHKKIPRLVPSIGIPTEEEISTNISNFLDPEIKPPPQFLGGNVLMFDGVALETKCRYCPYRNAILGLCREHSHRVNTQVDSLDSVDHVRIALQKDKEDPDKVCFGSDATVVAIGPYGQEDHYSPVPLVVSPSDKTEKGKDLAKWMQVILDTWESHPQGRKLHGRIEALASDGDSSYRLAKHILCMVKETDAQTSLGKIVHALVGLNCFTSKDGQLSTCDPKHIFKRDATLLRNFGGIMVGPTNIVPGDIVQYLADLPDVTVDQARRLLDPSDKQNVPKATSLVQQLNKLKELTLPPNPTQAQTRRAIVFFSTVLGHFVFPFITVEMSLSEQVESLSTYAFLAAALEIKHGSSCFTGPLYADSQATIKNIIFTIAKLQILNPNLKFYIILEGTDRLEVVFSDCRTKDHARNFDIDQLAGKLAVGALINAAFQRNPDLDRGNARVGDVDLPKSWDAGEIAANNLLEDYFGPSGRVDFRQRFSQPGFDLLRPLGHYVGLNPKHDDKRSEEENESELFPVNDGAQEEVPDRNRQGVVSSEEIQSVQNNPMEDQHFPDMPLGMDLDQFFPDDPPSEDDSGDNSGSDKIPAAFSKVLEAEGKKYLKSSLVATLSSNRSKKATMRTLRVRGVALEDLRSRKLGKICLGIFVVKGIKIGTEKSIRTAISLSELENPECKAKVICQLMEMQNPRMQGEDSPAAAFWEWTGNYICLDVNTQEERETRRLFVVEIPGVLIHPVGPSVSKSAGSNASEVRPTWSIPTEQLSEIMNDAWQSLDPEGKDISANVAQLVEVMNPDSLPYPDALGEPIHTSL